jgi:flagellar motor switch protein FliN
MAATAETEKETGRSSGMEKTATEAEVVPREGTLTKPLFKPLSGQGGSGASNDIDMILDIPIQLTVELGRTKISIKNLLQLSQGSVVELNAMAGDPLDILVNGTLVAQGEAVMVDDRLGIRLTDVITPAERIRKLNQ